MREPVYRHALPFVMRDLNIVAVEQIERTGLQGAAIMATDQIFLRKVKA